jgi:hypothetical protein
MTRLTGRFRNDDEGAILLLALAFLLLFALFIPALLGSTNTNISVSSTLDTQRKQVYAAESGLRTDVEILRNDRTAARYVNGADCGTTSPQAFNGYSVRVTCAAQPSSGENSLTRPQYALLALPPVTRAATEGVADSPTNGGGGGNAKIYVGGSVASNGIVERVGNSSSGRFVISGGAQGRSCVHASTIVDLGDNPDCTPVATVFTDPGPANATFTSMPTFPAATNPPVTCIANAAKLLPGYYTQMPVSGCGTKPWWFSPGAYYFDFTTGTHVLNLNGKTVVAGTPNPANYDPLTAGVGPSLPGSCKTDVNLPPYTGTELVFGADTVMDVGSGSIELCPDVSFTTQEISILGYGAGGLASTGVTTSTRQPTANSQAPAASYATPTNAYAIDGTNAVSVSIASGATKTITLSAFQAPPANASVEKVLLRIKHSEASSSGSATLAGTATYADATTTTFAVGCAANELCVSSIPREDQLDVTDAYLAAASTSIPAVSVAFSVKSPSGATTVESLDGIDLDVTYAPIGGYRRQSGCATLPVTNASECNTLGNANGGMLFVQGTVYASLGRVDITTASSGDPVQLERGVIARDIAGSIHPGGGAANLFGIGIAQRAALLTAQVLINGSWKSTISSLVTFDDNVALGTTRASVKFLSWRVIR